MHLIAAAVLVYFLSALSAAQAKTRVVTIFHTNDWQSRLLGFGPVGAYSPETTDNDRTVGGVARLATLLHERRKQAARLGPVFTFDSGDFTMGTLFHTIARETGGELQLLQLLGYDAVAIGNHEFDFGIKGLSQMIESALREAGRIVPLLASNMELSIDDTRDEPLRRLRQMGLIRRNLVISRGGIKVGLIGLMGRRAAEVIVSKGPVSFAEIAAASRRQIEILKQQGAELIVCLSHVGVKRAGEDWGGEELALAKAVPEIDVIVGGHSHTALKTPLKVKDTLIVQSGAEIRFLGELSLELQPKKRARLRSYKLHPVDDSVRGDDLVTRKVKGLQRRVSELVLAPLNARFSRPVVKVERTLTRQLDDHVLAKLVARAYQFAGRGQIGFEAQGNLRDDMYYGKDGIQSYADLFRIVPLGVGETDAEVGYPLVKLYFSGLELKQIVEVLLLAYVVRGEEYFPRFSGLEIEYSPYRIPLDRVMAIRLLDPSGAVIKAMDLSDTEQLYSVVTTSYVARFFWLIPQMSMGLFKIVPKDKNGKTISDLKDAVVKTRSKLGAIKELKAWHALIHHVEKLLPTGPSDAKLRIVPTTGALAQASILANTSLNPLIILKNASWITWSFLAATVFAFGLALLALRSLLRRYWRLRLKPIKSRPPATDDC